METVSQFHQNDPDIISHGQEHLAEIFRLTLLLGLEMDLADLCHAVNQPGNLGTEHLLKFFKGRQGIFDGIMEKARYHRRDVKLQVGQDPGNLHRMNQIRLAGKTRLSLMNLGTENISLSDQIQVT